MGAHLDYYHDHDIEEQLQTGRRDLARALHEAIQTAVGQVLGEHPKWDDLEERFNAAVDEFRKTVQPVQEDLTGFMEELLAELEKVDYGQIDPEDYFPRQVKRAKETGDVLFDSRRSYGDQLLAYKLQLAGGNSYGGDDV